jgi:hypothetical protein
MSRRPTSNRPHHPRPKASAISVTLAKATHDAIERAATRQGLSVAAYLSEVADVKAAELRRRERERT